MRKKDIILILSILIIAVLLLVVFEFIKQPGNYVVVYVDNEEYITLPLNKDCEVIIEGVGGTNHLIIENNSAYVSNASCPDKICMVYEKISNDGESIICLPHRVVITVERSQ